MAQAFTRELDDPPPPPPPERPVSPHANFVTRRGAALIDAELEHLRAALEAAPEREGELGRDLRYWLQRRATRQVVEPSEAPEEVAFGTRVTLRRRGQTQTLRIVGEDEADPANGLLAWTAPLARAIDGLAVGESAEFAAGGGTDTLEILRIGAD